MVFFKPRKKIEIDNSVYKDLIELVKSVDSFRREDDHPVKDYNMIKISKAHMLEDFEKVKHLIEEKK